MVVLVPPRVPPLVAALDPDPAPALREDQAAVAAARMMTIITHLAVVVAVAVGAAVGAQRAEAVVEAAAGAQKVEVVVEAATAGVEEKERVVV